MDQTNEEGIFGNASHAIRGTKDKILSKIKDVRHFLIRKPIKFEGTFARFFFFIQIEGIYLILFKG
jgi:hypothetical protein